MPRFVILRHQPPRESPRTLHWDLMLEAGQSLRTWALEAEPSVGVEIAADQLPDHRIEYLDYEGPVSGNRGNVRRWDAGTYELEFDAGERLQATMHGRILQCAVTIRRSAADDVSTAELHRWKVTFSPTPPDPDR